MNGVEILTAFVGYAVMLIGGGMAIGMGITALIQMYEARYGDPRKVFPDEEPQVRRPTDKVAEIWEERQAQMRAIEDLEKE